MLIHFNKDTSYLWTNSVDYNLMHIKRIEHYANQKLESYGFVMECEIENLLGIPKEFVDFDPNEIQFEQNKILHAWVKDNEKFIVFECFPQSNDDILINMNCGEYPLVIKEES